MATHVTVIYGESITVDYNRKINWADKGTSFPALPNTIHAIIWNNLTGQNEVQFKDELKDLVKCELKALVSCTSQEALLQNSAQISVVKSNELFKVIDLRQLLLQDRPLALHYCHHDVLIDGAQEVLHLLPE